MNHRSPFSAKTLFAVLLSFLMLGSLSGLQAKNKIRLNAGYWPGELTPELENRFFMDDLIVGGTTSVGLGRFDLGWSGKNVHTVYPLGLQYFMGLGKMGELMVGVNYMRNMPDYKFNGINLGGSSFSLVSLNDYYESNLDGEVGVRLALEPNKIFITPKAGLRYHKKGFEYDDLTIGAGPTYTITLSGPFDAYARTIYLGADFQFYIDPKISLIAEFTMTSPILGHMGGEMTFEQIQAGVVGGSVAVYTYSHAQSEYRITMNRLMLGMQYDITPTFHINGGIRTETMTSEYPNYFDLPFTIAAGGGAAAFNPQIMELLTDYLLILNAKETTERGTVFLGASVDLDFGS